MCESTNDEQERHPNCQKIIDVFCWVCCVFQLSFHPLQDCPIIPRISGYCYNNPCDGKSPDSFIIPFVSVGFLKWGITRSQHVCFKCFNTKSWMTWSSKSQMLILGCPLELGKRLKRQRYISHLVPNFTSCFNLASFQPVMATPISDTRGITFLESASSRALRNILRKLYMIYKSNQRKTLLKPPDCFVQIVQAGWPLE